jgi:hypothetical protein
MERVRKFRTADGKDFDTKRQALAHELSTFLFKREDGRREIRDYNYAQEEIGSILVDKWFQICEMLSQMICIEQDEPSVCSSIDARLVERVLKRWEKLRSSGRTDIPEDEPSQYSLNLVSEMFGLVMINAERNLSTGDSEMLVMAMAYLLDQHGCRHHCIHRMKMDDIRDERLLNGDEGCTRFVADNQGRCHNCGLYEEQHRGKATAIADDEKDD